MTLIWDEAKGPKADGFGYCLFHITLEDRLQNAQSTALHMLSCRAT